MKCSFCKYEGEQQDCWGTLRACRCGKHEYCLDDVLYHDGCKHFKKRTKFEQKIHEIGEIIHSYPLIDWILLLAGIVCIVLLIGKVL